MSASSPRIRSLLRQANRNEDVSKTKAAEQLYLQILDESPDTVDAWLGLARVATDDETTQSAYEQALALEPDNLKAQQALGLAPPDPPIVEEVVPEVLTEVLTASKVSEPETETTPIVVPVAEPIPDHEHDHALEYVDEADEEILYVCYRHPEIGTNLRCYNCTRPICSKCANRTPVGYMCPICVHEAEEAFFSATPLDYLSAAIVALILGLIGGFVARFIGFFVIFVAAGGGALIGRLSFRAARRRRGRYMPHLVAAMVIVGAVVPSLGTIIAVLFNPAAFLSLLWPAIYLFLAPAAAYWQVK